MESSLGISAVLPPSPSLMDELLAEREFVQRLARRLVRGDAHAADDLVQEVWRAALRNPPREPGSLRGWLRRVTHSQLVERLRRQGRAARAEHAAARPERVEARAPQELARRDACGQLAAALRELEEPYRTVIVLRFVEELPPREIARRLGRPVETVRTQTRRALARLRAKLEGRHGRDTTRALLGVLLLRPPRPRGLPPPAVLRVGGVALVGAAALVVGRRWIDAPTTVTAGAGLQRVGAERPSAVSGDRQATTSRQVVRGPSALQASPAQATQAALRRVDVTVVDAAERALAGARLAVHVADRTRPLGTTDAAGRLTLEVSEEDLLGPGTWILPEDGVELSAAFDGLRTRHVVVLLPDDGRLAVRLALDLPGASLRGRVVDAAGRALAGAQVAVSPVEGLGTRSALPGTPRAIEVLRPALARTDVEGRFSLEGLAPQPSWVAARAPGAASAASEVALTLAAPADLLLELAPAAVLRGQVRGPGGRAEAGALVELEPLEGPPLPLAWRRVRADDEGRFELPLPRAGGVDLSARGAHDDALRDRTRLWIEPGASPEWRAVLQPTLPLEARIVDARGRPRPGLYVTVRAAAGEGERDAAVTDADGRVRFRRRSSAPVVVDVYPGRSEGAFPVHASAPLVPGDGPAVELALDDAQLFAASLSGTLELVPPPGARLLVRHVASGTTHAFPLDGPSGALRADGLPPARYALALALPDGARRELGEVELAPGERRELGRVGSASAPR